MQELLRLTGDKGEIVKNFLSTLAENNRLGALEGVCEKFNTLMGAHRGEVELNITSAQVFLPFTSKKEKKRKKKEEETLL